MRGHSIRAEEEGDIIGSIITDHTTARYWLGTDMSKDLDRGTDSHTEGAHAASRPLEPARTKSGNVGIKYKRLIHRRCASLDLEAAFKCITLSRDIKPDLCKTCNLDKCQCPAFEQGMPCSSASSTSTNIDREEDDEVPELVPNKPVQTLYPPVLSPSDEEADREVAEICQVPLFYRLKARGTRRCRYYMYHAVGTVEDSRREKRTRQDSPIAQGYPEH